MRTKTPFFNRYTVRDNLGNSYGYYFFRSNAVILWAELTQAFPHATFRLVRTNSKGTK